MVEGFVRAAMRGVQYDGTNSAEVLDALPDISDGSTAYPPSITSETGGVLTIHYDGSDQGASGAYDLVLQESDWAILDGNPAVTTDTDLTSMGWVKLSDLEN